MSEGARLLGKPNGRGGLSWSLLHAGQSLSDDEVRMLKAKRLRVIPVAPENEGRSLDWLVDNYVTFAELR